MRIHYVVLPMLTAALAALMATPAGTVGRPGITPVACPVQTWVFPDPAFEALPGAKAYFGQYDGGVYRIEIPDKWNGELMLSSPRLRLERRSRRLQAARRQPGHPRAPDSERLCLGRIELPLQRLCAGDGAAGHDGADRHVHDLQRRPCARTRLSDRDVDGRPRHAARDARVPDRLRRRPRDVPGGTGALRLLHRRRRGRGGRHRRAVPETSTVQQDLEKMAGVLGKPPDSHRERTAAGERADRNQRRPEAIRGRGPRVPLSRQHQRRRARRQHHAVQSRRHQHAHPIQGGRGAGPVERSVERRCPPQGRRPQGPHRHGPVRRAGARSTAASSGRCSRCTAPATSSCRCFCSRH